jgi:hypothetical protein|tara:strand:- start:541 stop:675 length:135 start_codon:yes stop_codon:yes gene_type:complete
MPRVNGKKFPYTKAGMKKAAAAKARKAKSAKKKKNTASRRMGGY